MPLLTNYELHIDESTSVKLFVMSLVKMSSIDSNPDLFRSIFLVEFIFLFLTSTSLWYLVYCIGKYRLYHMNIVRLIQLFYISYYISILSRAVTFGYEMEVFQITGTLTGDFPLLICSFLRLEFIIIYAFMVPAMVAERCFASYYISDYEKKRRSWIFIILFIGALMLTAIVAVTVMRGFLSFGLCLFFSILAIIWVACFIIVYIFNKRKLDLLQRYYNTNEKYTLSIRFQLAENLRVMRQLIVLSLIISLLVFTALYFICRGTIWNELSSREGQISAALFEMWFSASAVILLFSFVLLNTRFRSGSLAIFGHKPSHEMIVEDLNRNKDDVTKLHFTVLSSYW